METKIQFLQLLIASKNHCCILVIATSVSSMDIAFYILDHNFSKTINNKYPKSRFKSIINFANEQIIKCKVPNYSIISELRIVHRQLASQCWVNNTTTSILCRIQETLFDIDADYLCVDHGRHPCPIDPFSKFKYPGEGKK